MDNLEAASAYIAQDSPHYAATLVREAREAARTLRQLANRGRVVPEVNDATVRELFVWRYRLIYRVRDREVQILAFIHGAQDFKGSLPAR